MNRELKFRAWDDYKMIHFSLSDLHGSDIGELRADQYCECEDLTSIVSSKTIMQFTGLHDKNGKEIYEGDIITRIINDKVKYNIIDFKPGGYVLSKINTRRFTTMYNSESYWYEVIGNIYETPALLDQ